MYGNERNAVLGFRTCKAILVLWQTWANEMNFVMNHAPGAGSIARRVDALPLYHG